MPILISSIIFCLLTAAISIYGYRVYSRPGRIFERLRELEPASPFPGPASAGANPGYFVQIIQRAGEKVPTSPADASQTRRYLMAAGFRSDAGVAIFHGYKLLGAVLLFLAGLAFVGWKSPSPVVRLALLGAAAFAGWSLPGIVVDRLIRRRHERLRFALPDALDLLVVCTEAGLGLDQGFVTISRDLRGTHKELCEELNLYSLEMRAGKSSEEALHHLADRTGEPEIRKLTAVMIQAERFGTSVAESMRTHADYLRIRRRQEAEERAAKVGVKLVFPIFFCILPSMIIVTAGPGVLQVLKYLIPMLSNFNR